MYHDLCYKGRVGSATGVGRVKEEKKREGESYFAAGGAAFGRVGGGCTVGAFLRCPQNAKPKRL